MNINFVINNVLRHKNMDSGLSVYFLGFDINLKRSKLQLFNDYIINNIFCNKVLNEKLIDIFCEMQKIYFAFNRLMFFYKLKKSKKMTSELDLYLTPLNLYPMKDKIKLLHMGMLYTFHLNDLMNMWKQSLIHSDDLFPSPKTFKNPYTNIPFQEHHLYNIYFKLVYSSLQIPFFIKESFKLNFDSDFFVIKFNELLKEIAIDNHIERCDMNDLYEDIQDMCEKLNDLYSYKFRVNLITNVNQKRIIVHTFKPYLQLFYRYTYSRNVVLKKHCMRLLKKEIKLFFEANSLFGRRLVFVNSANKLQQVEQPTITLTSETSLFLKKIKF